MLEEEMHKLKGVKVEENDVVLDIRKEGYIPNEYIREEEKVVIYKRLLQLSTLVELNNLKKEVIDRFGKMTKEVYELFEFNRIIKNSFLY